MSTLSDTIPSDPMPNRVPASTTKAETMNDTTTELDGMLAYQDAVANPRRDDPNWPLPSFDARDWAASFCETAAKTGHPGIDEGWMIGWFANALMRGFDEAALRATHLPASPEGREAEKGEAERRVKALDWYEAADMDFGHIFAQAWVAAGFKGFYRLERRMDGQFTIWFPLEGTGQMFADEIEAKAAAQADFERRVLACLHPAPASAEPAASVPEEVTPKMVDAAMLSLFGEFDESHNCECWVPRNWKKTTAKVEVALRAALASASVPDEGGKLRALYAERSQLLADLQALRAEMNTRVTDMQDRAEAAEFRLSEAAQEIVRLMVIVGESGQSSDDWKAEAERLASASVPMVTDQLRIKCEEALEHLKDYSNVPGSRRAAMQMARDTLREALGHFSTQPTVPSCEDCGRAYGDEHGFPDLVVPHDAWAKIMPDDGMLCPSCLCKRAHAAGIETTATFCSGPFASVPMEKVSDGRQAEDENLLADANAWYSNAQKEEIKRIHDMTEDELIDAWNHAKRRFDNRGKHGGSPGDSDYERMCEIETEQERRVALTPEASK